MKFSERLSKLSAPDEVSIASTAVISTVSFSHNLRGPSFGQLKVLRLSHCAIFHPLDYCYYHFVTTRVARRQHKMSHTQKHIKDVKILMTTFDERCPIAILFFLAMFEVEWYLKYISEVQSFLKIPSFQKERALDEFLAPSNAFTYAGLYYRPKYVNYILSAYPISKAFLEKVIKFMSLRKLPQKLEIDLSPRVNKAIY